MKPDATKEPAWTWPYPQTWGQLYRDIAALLIAFLAAAYLLDWLKGLLP